MTFCGVKATYTIYMSMTVCVQSKLCGNYIQTHETWFDHKREYNGW